MPDALSYALVAVVIGLLVLAHEAGHFWMARALGLPVARFSIGFGPRLWSWKSGGTELRISAVPLGGYVLLDLAHEAYFAIPLAPRVAFSAAGPLANLLLPLPLLAVLHLLHGDTSFHGLLIAPVAETLDVAREIALLLPSALSSPSNLSGVVGIVAQSGQSMLSVERVLSFASMLSINLAIFNLLPVPMLDGGKIAMDLLHRVSPRGVLRYAGVASAFGLALLLAVFAYVTALDIYRIAA